MKRNGEITAKRMFHDKNIGGDLFALANAFAGSGLDFARNDEKK